MGEREVLVGPSGRGLRGLEDQVGEITLAHLRDLIQTTRQMIPHADSLPEALLLVRRSNAAVKLIPEALRAYQTLEEEQFQLRQDAAELHLRTQRNAGELLTELAKHRGGRPAETASRMEGVSSPPTLKQLGITPQESHRWQRIGSLPNEVFESYIQEARQRRVELTTMRAVSLASRLLTGRELGVDAEPWPSGRVAQLAEFETIRRHLTNLVWLDPAVLNAAIPPADRQRVLADIRRVRRWLVEFDAALVGP